MNENDYYRIWVGICETYARKIGATLLFVNSDNFGIETKTGELMHIYADELEAILQNGV